MINKLYEKLKKFIKNNWLDIIVLIAMTIIMLYPLNYAIYVSGGTININDRIEINNSKQIKGSYNLAYVSQLKATPITYLLSYVIPSWDKENLNLYKANTNETYEDIQKRDKMDLDYSNQSAIKLAYEKAGKDFIIKDSNYFISFNENTDKNSVKVGDKLISINGVKVKELNDYKNVINNMNIGDEATLIVERNNKELEYLFKVKEEEGRKILGIGLTQLLDYETNPKIKVKFKDKESGPSGGLMMTLAIYDKLIDEELTKGLKIVGTGTIEYDGSVGQIGGVKYKLKGAVRKKADIFLAPQGDNYDECIKLQKKYKYKIKIISVSTFDEAVEKLRNINKNT